MDHFKIDLIYLDHISHLLSTKLSIVSYIDFVSSKSLIAQVTQFDNKDNYWERSKYK